MGDFQKLRVWQIAKEIAVKIYKLTRSKEFSKDFGLSAYRTPHTANLFKSNLPDDKYVISEEIT